MFTRTRIALLKSCSEFKQNSEGSVASIFALALIPVVGLVGAAVDYSQANNVRTTLQARLDAALIAGARDGSTSWATTALNTFNAGLASKGATDINRSEEHTSELQSRSDLVCRLLLEKKKKKNNNKRHNEKDIKRASRTNS